MRRFARLIVIVTIIISENKLRTNINIKFTEMSKLQWQT